MIIILSEKYPYELTSDQLKSVLAEAREENKDAL